MALAHDIVGPGLHQYKLVNQSDISMAGETLDSVAGKRLAICPAQVITAVTTGSARTHGLAKTAETAINPETLLLNPPKTL